VTEPFIFKVSFSPGYGHDEDTGKYYAAVRAEGPQGQVESFVGHEAFDTAEEAEASAKKSLPEFKKAMHETLKSMGLEPKEVSLH
jgi:hypothetical protein